ncbi:MAG: dienelactone hydrolase family protein [Gemmatimonadaceae bacterium]|nr:dienelactone hydrolase family protein [Gemmatimonadaceae bacterium]
MAATLLDAHDAGAQLRRGREAPRRREAPREREVLQHGGRDRTYVVRVPEAVARRNVPVPLVVVLHGGGGNADNAERMFAWSEKGRREGFIVVYPEGTARGRRSMYTWNAGHCCGFAMENRVDDVGFIDALITQLQREYTIDPARVYITGMSNGAMMAHRLGIALSHRVAAIAPVVGALFGDEASPASPVSAIVFNGMVDQSVPYDGGAGGGIGARAWDGTPTKPALQQGTFWAAANGCASAPSVDDRGRLVVTSYECPRRRDVILYALKDGGHAWPGGKRGTRMGDDPGTAVDATALIWEFFAAHPRR